MAMAMTWAKHRVRGDGGRRLALALALALGACGGGDDDGAGPDGGAGDDGGEADAAGLVDAGVDPSAALFAPDRVLAIEIELADADWEALRLQGRSFFDVLGQSCLTEPPGSPFTYFPATVRIDGDELAQVGVRKKGFFGSLSTTKPSLKLDFDEYVADREYGGLERMTLNNALSDSSYIKQCLGYQLFARAGVPAPRCSFARVEVNGLPLGVYVHVESVDKRFLRRHFADDDGNLYEGALSDFRPGWVETFDKKTNEDQLERADLDALVTALDVPDNDLAAALAPLVDVDRFDTFWAMEVLLMHADGYARNTNNFLIYDDPSDGRFAFIPWGIDSILFTDTALPWESVQPPPAAWAEGSLAWRLYRTADGRAAYLARLGELLDDVWNETAILDEIERMKTLLDPQIGAVEQQGFDAAVAAVRAFVGGRRAVLEAALAGPPASWDAPLRAPWCIDVLGHVEGTLSTTWGTLEAEDPWAAGQSLVDTDLPDVQLSDFAGGATAGISADSGRAALRTISLIGPSTVLLVQIELDASALVPNTSLPIDWLAASGYAMTIDFAAEPAAFNVIGLLASGTLELGEASDAEGGAISATFAAEVYENTF